MTTRQLEEKIKRHISSELVINVRGLPNEENPEHFIITLEKGMACVKQNIPIAVLSDFYDFDYVAKSLLASLAFELWYSK